GIRYTNTDYTLDLVMGREITGLTTDDFEVIAAGASVTEVEEGDDASQWTISVTVTDPGDILIRLSGGSVEDTDGNVNTASNWHRTNYSTSVPTFTLTPRFTGYLISSLEFSVNVALSEPVTSLVAGDFTSSNGDVVDLVKLSDTSYIVTVLAEEDGETV